MSQQLLDAYDTLFDSLWERMARMLGNSSTRALWERAQFETARENPLADDIVLQSSGIDLSNFKKRTDLSTKDMRDTLNGLVVNLVSILTEQLGRTIADQIAKKAVMPNEQTEQ